LDASATPQRTPSPPHPPLLLSLQQLAGHIYFASRKLNHAILFLGNLFFFNLTFIQSLFFLGNFSFYAEFWKLFLKKNSAKCVNGIL